MYCMYCGGEIASDSSFCQHCGKVICSRQNKISENGPDLISQARRGDQQAISILYEQTYSKVFYTVKSMIKDEDAVFDIIQDSYIKAFSHLGRFEGSNKFLPWVKQIAANTARDWLKKKRPLCSAN